MIAAFARRLRGELRLYRNRVLVVILLLQCAVGGVSLLVGQDYAGEQIAIANSKEVASCERLLRAGVPPDGCTAAQVNQAYSKQQLGLLRDRIGPPAKASTTARGTLAFELGHASTAVGLAGLVLVAATVLGGEAEAGLRRARDVMFLGRSAFAVRTFALIVVWSAMTVLTWLSTWAVSYLAGLDVGWSGPADFHASSRFVATRLAGAGMVITTFSAALVASRRWLRDRPRWLAIGSAIAAALLVFGGTGAPGWPPTNAGWGLQRFDPDLSSFIDRYPMGLLVRRPPTVPTLVIFTVALVLTVGASVVVGRREQSSR